MTAPEQSTPPTVLASMWRYRWVTLGIVVALTTLSGIAGLLTQAPTTATAMIALKSPSADNVITPGVVGDASTGRYVEQRAQFVTNDRVLGKVASDIGGVTISELRERLTVEPISGANIITLSAEGSSAAEAVDLANATVAAYRSVNAELVDELRTEATDEFLASQEALRGAADTGNEMLAQAAATTLADLQQRGAELRVNALLFGDGVDFVNAARLEDAEVPGLPVRELAVGSIMGLALAGVVAYLCADRERRITDSPASHPGLDTPPSEIFARADGGGLLTPRRGIHSNGASAETSPRPSRSQQYRSPQHH